MGVLVLVAVLVVAIVAHELAHAVVARLVGLELFEIQIGGGPITSFHVGSVVVRLGPIPIGGSVQTGSPHAEGFRGRTMAVAAAGPAANVVLAVACLLADFGPGIVFNVIAAAANLWPGRRQSLGEASSDGRLLLDLARGDVDALTEERSAWWTVQALRCRDEGDLDGATGFVEAGIAEVGRTRSLLAVAGVVAFAQHRFVDVVDAYAELIDHDRVPVAARAGFAADAAWSASLSEDPALRRLALPWAALARAVSPRDRRRCVVHALALVDAGRAGTAIEELAGIDDTNAQAVMALALVADGDRDVALERARTHVVGRLDPTHPLHVRLCAALPELLDR